MREVVNLIFAYFPRIQAAGRRGFTCCSLRECGIPVAGLGKISILPTFGFLGERQFIQCLAVAVFIETLFFTHHFLHLLT